jgi:CHASE2 domain-containing sensor protein
MAMIRNISILLFSVIWSCKSQSAESDIVLVNVGSNDREGIAKQISAINFYNPKVIAIDLQFFNDTEYSKDSFLSNELSKCKEVVMASLIGDYSEMNTQHKWFANESEPWFLINAKTGFINTILEKDEFQTLKRFSIVEKVKGETEYHFAIQTTLLFDSLKATEFIKSNPKIINVDYRNGTRKFKTFSASEAINNKLTKKDIEGKIVMLGFLGPGNEDKFFTPLNANPNEPDMYGLEYLANVVAQVLESK